MPLPSFLNVTAYNSVTMMQWLDGDKGRGGRIQEKQGDKQIEISKICQASNSNVMEFQFSINSIEKT